ncbi:putative ribonuclease H-like domain-containing protein [Tanacetum coccineum]
MASSSASFTSLILIYYSTSTFTSTSTSNSTSTSSSMKLHHSFRICLRMLVWGKLIQKLRQKEVDEESCLKTCSYGTWFFKLKKEYGGRGVKGKDLNRNNKNTSLGIGVSMDSEDIMNDDTPIGVASVIQEGVTPSVINMTVEMEKQYSLDDNTILKSFPPLSTPVTTTTSNAPGKSSYANVTGKPSRKKLNFCTLFTPRGNMIDVVVPVESIRAISARFANTAYGGLDSMLENGSWFIWNNPLILKKWHPNLNLLKDDVSTILVWVKLHGVLITAFSEDGLSAISTKLGRSSYVRAMIELRVDVEFKDKIVVNMRRIAGEGHYTCNIHVEYEWKPPRTINLVNNEANSSGSSFMNVDNSSTSTTSIIDKIGKFEDLLSRGQAILVDNAGNPLGKIELPGDYDSEDEVASIDNDMARSLASERVGFGAQSLLEQWRDLYGNGDYDEDPYDDDMYEGQDVTQ